MIINYTLDTSITSNPLASSIEKAISQAVSFYQQEFTNSVTLTLDFGFGESDGQALPSSAAAETYYSGNFYSYGTIRSALTSHDVLTQNSSIVLGDVLPTTDPTNGGQFFLTVANQKALGLTGSTGGEADAYIGLSSALAYNWTQSIVSGSNTVDAVGAFEHEISEAMGRTAYAGSDFDNSSSTIYGMMDLYRYASANGTTTNGRVLTPGPGYYSLDGHTILKIADNTGTAYGATGAKVAALFNDPRNGGDVADWSPGIAGGDSFGSAANGVANAVGSTDITILDGLGWTRSTKPDLSISNLNVDKLSFAPGATVTVHYELDNYGVSAATPSPTAFVLSSDTTLTTGDIVIGAVTEASLAGDSSITESVTFQLPTTLPGGAYYLGAIANNDHSLVEGVTSNDVSTDIVQIAVSGAPVAPSTISVQSFLANQASLDKGSNGFAVTDTAQAISAAIDHLNDAHINAILVSDTLGFSVTASQLTADALALGKIHLVNPLASETFAFNLSDEHLVTIGGNAFLTGLDSVAHDITGTHQLAFNDGTINETPGLVDNLYYDLNNLDVYNAKADPAAHYSANGWHEGRNPDADFSTIGYLATQQDIAAAGINPLSHYDSTGWKEGRDPSANFDTALYLLHNPDVKAANIDPLQHYLTNGQAEGRQAYAAIGPSASFTHGSFDAEYYLLANPDVAKAALASGENTYVFAYQHYESNGWHEGRNPDAFFNVNYYLAANPDVKAAGIDPLAHYDTNGWQEGRNPSAAFNTAGYEAQNADVAQAHIDPLQHYLQHGALEGRAA